MKNVSPKVIAESPVAFFVYDLLEYEGIDFRKEPFDKRRTVLEKVVHEIQHPLLHASPVVQGHSWEELYSIREKSREMLSEGLMLKRKSSIYQAGRKRGDWWKWKIDPFTIDAVMIYAQKGSGKRSNLYTDYTLP